MSAHTVNISFQNELLEQIDSLAKEEFRSRSEIIREAARMYISRKERWKNIFTYGNQLQSETGITEQDILDEIKAVRKNK